MNKAKDKFDISKSSVFHVRKIGQNTSWVTSIYVSKFFFSNGNNGELSQKSIEKVLWAEHVITKIELDSWNHQQQFSNCQLSCTHKKSFILARKFKKWKSERSEWLWYEGPDLRTILGNKLLLLLKRQDALTFIW